jgi:hypothetical protein
VWCVVCQGGVRTGSGRAQHAAPAARVRCSIARARAPWYATTTRARRAFAAGRKHTVTGVAVPTVSLQARPQAVTGVLVPPNGWLQARPQARPRTLSSGRLAYSLGTSKGKPLTMAASTWPTYSSASRCLMGTCRGGAGVAVQVPWCGPARSRAQLGGMCIAACMPARTASAARHTGWCGRVLSAPPCLTPPPPNASHATSTPPPPTHTPTHTDTQTHTERALTACLSLASMSALNSSRHASSFCSAASPAACARVYTTCVC